MKKKGKTPIIILFILLITFAIFSKLYISERNEILDKYNEVVNLIENIEHSLYTEEFKDFYKENVLNYKLRTNKQIKELTNTIENQMKNGSCFIVANTNLFNQIPENEILEHVNNFLNNCRDYNVGKLFIYTNDNLGELLSKNVGYVDCSIYAYNLTDEMIVDNEAKIKVRGNSTSKLLKKPYNIKFSEKQDLYGFGKSKKWSLLADALDPTMLRNRLSLDFANYMDLDYTSNCEYVELWLDDAYLGNYLLTESVETGKTRVDIDTDNGDFLFEYESSRIEDDVTYITTNHGWRFAMSDPEEPDDESLKYLENTIQLFDDTIYSDDYQKVKDLIDVDSFAKLYLLNEFTKTVDFDYSSVNFYYKDGIFYAGPAWDFDLSSGNADMSYVDYWIRTGAKENGILSFISYEGLWCSRNLIYSKLLEYPEFMDKVVEYFNKYEDYIKEMYKEDGTIDNLLDKYGELINNNYAPKNENGAEWPFIYNINLRPFDTYEENVNYLKLWQKNRYDFLSKEFAK